MGIVWFLCRRDYSVHLFYFLLFPKNSQFPIHQSNLKTNVPGLESCWRRCCFCCWVPSVLWLFASLQICSTNLCASVWTRSMRTHSLFCKVTESCRMSCSQTHSSNNVGSALKDSSTGNISTVSISAEPDFLWNCVLVKTAFSHLALALVAPFKWNRITAWFSSPAAAVAFFPYRRAFSGLQNAGYLPTKEQGGPICLTSSLVLWGYRFVIF